MGYDFKPWKSAKAIADGPSILAYIQETVTEHNLSGHIQLNHRVEAADWDSTQSLWRVSVTDTQTQQTCLFTCSVLYVCAGYYDYKKGYLPKYPNLDAFEGTLIHPQHWPKDLAYDGKNVVIIGSGATAVTLLPSMAPHAHRVTMLQRSPTYLVAWPAVDRIGRLLKRLMPLRWAYFITRQKNIRVQQFVYGFARRYPQQAKRWLLRRIRKELGPDFDIQRHFTPSYNPWEQRLCLTPDSDFFHALRSENASICTDRIEHFTKNGIQLTSGAHLDADIVVSATGLNLALFGKIQFSINGSVVDCGQRFTYKGVALSGMPNLFACFGYINASWTLRADLTSRFVCRVLNHMANTQTQVATPTLDPRAPSMNRKPWVDGFSPGYFRRAGTLFPVQGDMAPWHNPQNYAIDQNYLINTDVADGILRFQ